MHWTVKNILGNQKKFSMRILYSRNDQVFKSAILVEVPVFYYVIICPQDTSFINNGQNFSWTYNMGHQFANSLNLIYRHLSSLQWMWACHVFQETVVQGQLWLKVYCYFDRNYLHLLLILFIGIFAALFQQCFNMNSNIHGFKDNWLPPSFTIISNSAFQPNLQLLPKEI